MSRGEEEEASAFGRDANRDNLSEEEEASAFIQDANRGNLSEEEEAATSFVSREDLLRHLLGHLYLKCEDVVGFLRHLKRNNLNLWENF